MTQLTAGHPEPLGARFDGKGVNFTLFVRRDKAGNEIIVASNFTPVRANTTALALTSRGNGAKF